MRIALAAIAALSVASTAQAGSIVAATGAAASSTSSTYNAIETTIDGRGLLTPYTVGGDFDAYIAADPLHTTSSLNAEWFADAGSSATIVYDLGSLMSIESLALWNEDSYGLGSAALSISDDGITYTSLTSITPTDNPKGASYGADVFTLAATFRYLQLEATCASTYCTIGEVLFESGEASISSEVPVPGALPLMLGGLGAFAALRRRG